MAPSLRPHPVHCFLDSGSPDPALPEAEGRVLPLRDTLPWVQANGSFLESALPLRLTSTVTHASRAPEGQLPQPREPSLCGRTRGSSVRGDAALTQSRAAGKHRRPLELPPRLLCSFDNTPPTKDHDKVLFQGHSRWWVRENADESGVTPRPREFHS